MNEARPSMAMETLAGRTVRSGRAAKRSIPRGSALPPLDTNASLAARTNPADMSAHGRKHVVVVASLTRSLVNFRFELLKAMVAAGHRVTALAPDADPETIATLERIGVAFQTIPMARTGTNPIADLRTLGALYRKMRRLAPDVMLAYTMKPIIYGGLAARLAGVRQRFALFTGFGYMFGDGLRGFSTAVVRRLSIQLYRLSLVGATGVFFYNDADGDDIRRHAMIGAGTPMMPVDGSGVDLELHKRSEIPAGPPVFLLVARLLREKGVAEFAAAARVLKPQFPEARFQILGPFYSSPLALTPAEIQGWAADGAVEYLGETSDVRPYLAASSVFVLPSYYREGIPRSALEALATGRPIVTTNAPGCRETVIHGKNGFHVPPRDAEALAAAMRAFLDDPSLAPRMGARSRQLAEERFDVHAVNRTLLAALGLHGTADPDSRSSTLNS